MVYSFKPNGSFRIQYKPIDPDNEDVSHAISIFYISVGSLANMVQTHVKDTHDYLESHPEYYKREIKFNIKEAHKRIDNLMDVFKKKGQGAQAPAADTVEAAAQEAAE